MSDAVFRTYDASWNRTGYAAQPQYSGQAALTEDYPPKCHCGSVMLGCGDAGYLQMQHTLRMPNARRLPSWVSGRTDYVAWCANDHEMKREPVA